MPGLHVKEHNVLLMRWEKCTIEHGPFFAILKMLSFKMLESSDLENLYTKQCHVVIFAIQPCHRDGFQQHCMGCVGTVCELQIAEFAGMRFVILSSG